MVRKTRFEENQDLLEERSAVFIPQLAEAFKCVFRAKKRGEGLMIDRDHLKEIDAELTQLSNDLDKQARKETLATMGIEFDYFHQYRDANPDNLSSDALDAKRSEYFDKEWERKKLLRREITPTLGNRPLCLHLGAEVKSHEYGSYFSSGATFGSQTAFLPPEWSPMELITVGSTFVAISKGRGPPFRSVRYYTRKEAEYQSPPKIIHRHVTSNIVICKTLATPPDVCDVYPKVLAALEDRLASE